MMELKSSKLDHIKAQLEEAKVLTTYEHDWDDEGGVPADIEVYRRSVEFVTSYANSILDKGVILCAPYLDILSDGAICVQWDTEKGKFLIIFKKDVEKAFFHAYIKGSDISINSHVKDNTIDKMLEDWMENYLQ